MDRIGAERGWGPTSRAAFDAQTALRGAYVVGEPERVAEKILFHHELFGHDRTLLQLGIGTVPHREVMRAIELFGTRVAPEVRRQLVNYGPGRLVMLALGGAVEHNGRDGEAFSTWEQDTPAPPQEVPFPDDLDRSELRS